MTMEPVIPKIKTLLARLDEHPRISRTTFSLHWSWEHDWPAIMATVDGTTDVWFVILPELLDDPSCVEIITAELLNEA